MNIPLVVFDNAASKFAVNVRTLSNESVADVVVLSPKNVMVILPLTVAIGMNDEPDDDKDKLFDDCDVNTTITITIRLIGTPIVTAMNEST